MAELRGAGVSLKRKKNQKFWVSILGDVEESKLLELDQWVQLWYGEQLLWSGMIKAVSSKKTKARASVDWKLGNDDFDTQDTVDVDVTVNPTELSAPTGAQHYGNVRVINDGPN